MSVAGGRFALPNDCYSSLMNVHNNPMNANKMTVLYSREYKERFASGSSYTPNFYPFCSFCSLWKDLSFMVLDSQGIWNSYSLIRCSETKLNTLYWIIWNASAWCYERHEGSGPHGTQVYYCSCQPYVLTLWWRVYTCDNQLLKQEFTVPK